jgi:hypothetical protein
MNIESADQIPEPDRITAALTTAFRRVMASNEAILTQALDEVLGEHAQDPPWIKTHISEIVSGFEDAAHRAYRVSETRAQGHALREVFGTMVRLDAPSQDLLDALVRNCTALDKFCLSIAQGRRSRAGSALEACLSSIFDRLGYPYSSCPVINGKPDFVFPSVDHYRRLATDCIVFTSKRTLRERWRQIISEGARGAHFFLATLDPDVRAPDLREMRDNRVNLVVPESIRTEKYANQANVLSFESFVLDHADPAMARWRRNGVIP